MREDQFIKLSQAGENAQIEYKTCYEQISDSLYETVCSFLNHSGGHILVGVKDNGEIVGVNPDKATTLQGEYHHGHQESGFILALSLLHTANTDR